MKKFIRILICFCLCVISLTFTACSGETKIEAPDINDTVYSNGGLVVRKGDFVYFANGYSSVQAIVDGETKLQKSYSMSNLAVSKYNSNGTFERTDNGSLEKMDSLSKKLAGFEATDLHVYGNYIYFTTVNTEKNKNGENQVQKLEIRRIKLNGTSSETVYRSKVNYVDSDGNRVVNFYYFEQEGNVYILINENGVLKRIQCTDSKVDSAEKVSDSVLSIVVPEEDETNMDGIFFLTTDNSCSVINRYDVTQNKVVTKKTLDSHDSIDSLFASKFGNVYFYATFHQEGKSFLYYLSYEQFEDYSISYNSTLKNNRIVHETSTKVYLLENVADGILAIDSNEVKIVDHFNPSTIITLKNNLPASANIVLIDNGFVYYYADSEIKCWNYITDTTYTIITETNTICDYGFDLVNNYLYYFATCGENDYMFRVNVKIENNETSELVGVYTEKDDPTIEESSSGQD